MPIFRRRPIAARWRPGRAPGPIAEAALLRLRQAHARMAEGDYAQAATLFGELADSAAVHGLPRAPQLALQAGRAWLLAGDMQRSLPRLRQGLTLLVETGQPGRLPAAAGRVLGELRARGHPAEAESLEAELRALVPGLALATMPAAPGPTRRRLPAKCPSCGGSVRPDAVQWLDDNTAECEYCGSTIQTGA